MLAQNVINEDITVSTRPQSKPESTSVQTIIAEYEKPTPMPSCEYRVYSKSLVHILPTFVVKVHVVVHGTLEAFGHLWLMGAS